MFKEVSCEVNGAKADITIRCEEGTPIDAQVEKLASGAARAFVLALAVQRGIQGNPGISSTTNIVPYTKEGVALDDIYSQHVAKHGNAPIDRAKMQNDHYAVTFKVLGKQ